MDKILTEWLGMDTLSVLTYKTRIQHIYIRTHTYLLTLISKGIRFLDSGVIQLMTFIHTQLQTYIHTYIQHTIYIHTYIHTYTYICTYIYIERHTVSGLWGHLANGGHAPCGAGYGLHHRPILPCGGPRNGRALVPWNVREREKWLEMCL